MQETPLLASNPPASWREPTHQSAIQDRDAALAITPATWCWLCDA
ncbi:hypothetical protein KSC_021980 [Ktedonobacter sp. SOSP1-52]|nr:hypothetical protein KSC_021980 [Ktedonobacter sp. SOSP1-52]